ncbi:MAG: hypothetical protein KI790_08245 [Cyclobacteriaceae bacterium]|nr:hypothetical protein [Cyclobacteriaceae bacterium HetDA_MAG_MS6]
MKIIKVLLLLTTASLLFFLVSCEESNFVEVPEDEPIAGSDDQGKSYFISTAEIDLEDVNGTLILDECVTDNTITYYQGGRYEENEGRTKCGPQTLQGSSDRGFYQLIKHNSPSPKTM